MGNTGSTAGDSHSEPSSSAGLKSHLSSHSLYSQSTDREKGLVRGPPAAQNHPRSAKTSQAHLAYAADESGGRERILESREVHEDPDDVADRHRRHSQNPRNSLLQRNRLSGSAFDVDVEKGDSDHFRGVSARKGSWAETVVGVVDGLFSVAKETVQESVADWASANNDRASAMPGNFASLDRGSRRQAQNDRRPSSLEEGTAIRASSQSSLPNLAARPPPARQPVQVHPLSIQPPTPTVVTGQFPARHQLAPISRMVQPINIPTRPLPSHPLSAYPEPPQSAIPHSPPKDIGDGILARRAYGRTAEIGTPTLAAASGAPGTRSMSPSSLRSAPVLTNPDASNSTRPPLIDSQLLASDVGNPDPQLLATATISAPKLSRVAKYNSCSTLFVDSTITNADLTDTLRCVASALVNHMKDTTRKDHCTQSPDILSEEKHPLSQQIRFYRRRPKEEDVFKFLECLFNAAELTAECGIITLIYVERMISNASLRITSANWTRIVLGALLLASKVWDDHAVWNVDFVQIFPEVDVSDMNDLERYYMATLAFDVNIKSSEYAKYYFALRDLTDSPGRRDLPKKPLTASQRGRLEPRPPAIPPKEVELELLAPGSSSQANTTDTLSGHSERRNDGSGSVGSQAAVTVPQNARSGTLDRVSAMKIMSQKYETQRVHSDVEG
ncbi:hypothetical protein HKX48_008692 [Thoreauomyces humboldtii]|nr:hypothetical protein HKX48_008692 [Thoreauomyces humboldtii]